MNKCLCSKCKANIIIEDINAPISSDDQEEKLKEEDEDEEERVKELEMS